MDLIERASDLFENVERLQAYLARPGLDREFAVELIRRGICFIVTQDNATPFFAPSRFIGYHANTRDNHIHNADKDGRDTNAAIEAILRMPPMPSDSIEAEYVRFCASLGISVRSAPFGIQRKFWDLR